MCRLLSAEKLSCLCFNVSLCFSGLWTGGLNQTETVTGAVMLVCRSRELV